jgi:hypothetical protein
MACVLDHRYYDQILENNVAEDAATTLLLFDALLRLVKKDPDLAGKTDITFQSDNAGCYNCNLFARLLWVVAHVNGYYLKRYINNESGDGKTVLDGHFGRASAAITTQVRQIFWP